MVRGGGDDSIDPPVGSRQTYETTAGGGPGRPRDDDLTARLIAAAGDLVADRGLVALNATDLASRCSAGKAGVYRRWPDMDSLVAETLTFAPLVAASPTGVSWRDDLRALVAPLSTPLTTRELTAASVLSRANHSPTVRAALEGAITEPLTAHLDLLISTWAARPGGPGNGRLLLLVIRGLWWDRYVSGGAALTTAELDQLVDDVLLPLVRRH